MLPATSGAARRFIAAATLLVAIDASGQATARLPRVGFCSPGIPEAQLVNYAHEIPQFLLAGMRERGWHHGKNYDLVFRTAVGRPGGMPACLDSLISEPVDVLIVFNLKLATEKTRTLPIVAMVESRDLSFVATHQADSKRNFTGITRDTSLELWRKQLALFKEAANLERIVIVSPWEPSPDFEPGLQRDKPANLAKDEQIVGVAIDRWRLTAPHQIESACAAIARSGRTGILVGDSALWVTWFERHPKESRGISNHCVERHRLPVMYGGASGAGQPGILIGYGPNFGDMLGGVPYFVDRILKGAKPADLPIQHMENYRLGLNLAVARKIGVTIPASILVRADIVFDDEREDRKGPPAKARY